MIEMIIKPIAENRLAIFQFSIFFFDLAVLYP